MKKLYMYVHITLKQYYYCYCYYYLWYKPAVYGSICFSVVSLMSVVQWQDQPSLQVWCGRQGRGEVGWDAPALPTAPPPHEMRHSTLPHKFSRSRSSVHTLHVTVLMGSRMSCCRHGVWQFLQTVPRNSAPMGSSRGCLNCLHQP